MMEPEEFSKSLTGDFSGLRKAFRGTIKVCSKAYCPDKAACVTVSVKTIQQELGGKSQ